MSRLPQLLPGQQAISWYQSGFFWAGIAIVIIALLILVVPPKNWRRIWQLMLGLPRWIYETYIWKRYGPKYTIGDPSIDSKILENSIGTRYTANVVVTITNWDKYPLEVDLRWVKVCVAQKAGWKPLSIGLTTKLGQGIITLKSGETGRYPVVLDYIWNGNSEGSPNIHSRYKYGVQGIYVIFRGNRRELHRGLYCKPIPQKVIGTW